MAVLVPLKMLLPVVLCCSFFICSSAVEEVVIVNAPDAIKLLSNEPIHSSYLGEIGAAMFAYSVHSNVEWHSLAVVSPWNRPEAIVMLEITGFDNKIDLPLEGSHFLLANAEDLPSQFDLLSIKTQERFFGKNPILLRMELGNELHDSKIVQPLLLKALPADPKKRLKLALKDASLGQLINDSTFNPSVPSDVKLLTELATVKEFLKAIQSHKSDILDAIPDVYWLKISGLEPIVNAYGSDSIQFKEALRLLRQIISETEATMRNVYDDNVVVAVIKTNSASSVLGHKNRRLLETTTEKPEPVLNYNLAAKWDPLFPVIFALMLFVFIMLVLAVLSVTVAMWNMDPGRDSIIYRMTTHRMKKD